MRPVRATPQSERRLRAAYLLTDWLSTNAAWLLFDIFRYLLLPTQATGHHTLGTFLLSGPVMLGQLLFPLMMVVLYALSGYYEDVYRRSRLQEALNTAATVGVGTMVILLVALVNDLTSDRTEDYRLIAILFGTLFATVYLPRLVMTTRTMRRIRSGKLLFPTLIVRPSDEPGLPVRLPVSMGMEVAAQLSVSPDGLFTLADGSAADPSALCSALGIRYVVVVPPAAGVSRMLAAVAALYRATDAPVMLAPGIGDIVTRRYGDAPQRLMGPRTRQANIDGDPLTDISRPALPTVTLNLKRLADVVVSAAALLLTGVPILVLALAVRLDSPGPAFYRQRRIGLRGKPFDIIKLRTMCADAEAAGPQLSSEGDPRITRIGRVLRRYRLDEFPQFWNVLRGQMSLVGPRPEREHYARQLLARQPAYALVHQIRPGLTGLGMVKYGYAATVDEMEERLRHDLLYIENIGLALDLKVIFYTIHTVLSGKGL